MIALFVSTILLNQNPDVGIPDDVREYFAREATEIPKEAERIKTRYKHVLFPNNKPRPTKKEADRLKAQMEQEIEALPTRGVRLDFEKGKAHDGQLGHWSYRVRIIQVVSDDTLMVDLADETWMLKGMSTKGLADDEHIKPQHLLKIDGTESYKAVSGARKTIRVMRAMPDDYIDKHREKYREEIERSKAATEKAKQETAKAKKAATKEMNPEDAAANKLKLTKAIKNANPSAYKVRLQEIIDKYPETEAAKEAAELLGK